MKPMKSHNVTQLLAIVSAAALTGFFATSAHASPKLRDLDKDGIPNLSDTDIDNDGILNGDDRNVDGGLCIAGPLTGRYIGDRLSNHDAREKDIDDDGLLDHAINELDIDGDGLVDSDSSEVDIDGDGLPDSSPHELNTDGDDHSDRVDLDDDGDGVRDGDDDDDDGDALNDRDDDDHDGAVLPLATGPVGSGAPPENLVGTSYLVRKSGKHDLKRLSFTGETTGKEIEGREVEAFTYTYAVNSATSAVVTISEKPSEYKVLTLDFSTGTFTQQEFEHGRLDEVRTGNFSL